MAFIAYAESMIYRGKIVPEKKLHKVSVVDNLGTPNMKTELHFKCCIPQPLLHSTTKTEIRTNISSINESIQTMVNVSGVKIIYFFFFFVFSHLLWSCDIGKL